MAESLLTDLFVEDRAHEEFLVPLLHRVARERGTSLTLHVRAARGGHGRALSELELYQTAMAGGLAGLILPDLIVVGIDGNCQPHHLARQEIRSRVNLPLRDRTVIACPDPHIERWFLADPTVLAHVIGSSPRVRKGKCERGYYKSILLQAVIDGGHVPTLGGIEFAKEIVEAMDLYRACRADRSLKSFLDDLAAFLEAS